ncbi:MAG TPA: GNAT family N-acetyltransferase [Thermomicrobiales bacterium]|nr:GNAT family N-acetyltransferase [Thermomicrobiales bacterium]
MSIAVHAAGFVHVGIALWHYARPAAAGGAAALGLGAIVRAPKRARSAVAVRERALAGLRVEVVRTHLDLARHAAAWDDLALAAPQQLPMLAYPWVASYLEHRLAPSETWLCILAYREGQLIGVLPVVIDPHPLLGRWQPRLRAPAGLHTRSGQALLRVGQEAPALSALLAALEREVPGYVGLEMRGVREGSPLLAALARDLPGMVVERELDGYGSFIRLSGTYRDYQAGLGPKMRNNLRRAGKRLAQLPGADLEFLAGAAATERDLPRFMALEAAGWKGRRGTALAQDPALVAFYTALTHRLAARGWLEWHFLTAEEQTIAGHLAVRFGRALVMPKIAYDEAYAQCAPGNVLFERVVERAFASGDVDEINQTSDMPWHRNWRMEQAAYYNVWLFPRRPTALLCGAWPTSAHLRARRRLRPLARRARRRWRQHRAAS